MPITKQFQMNKKPPLCKISFHLGAAKAADAQEVCVVGDFNGWDTQALPMKRDKKGNFTAQITLPVGGVQRFRYIADKTHWLTDLEADGLEYCSFAQGDNSLLSLEP